MSGTSNRPTRLAHVAALVGAGATAATVVRVVSRKPAAALRGAMSFAKTIAEFVEAKATVRKLREKGVDCSQSYFHGAPRPVATEFAQMEVPR